MRGTALPPALRHEFLAADALLLDGRSGSGKTALAAELAAALTAAGRAPQLLQVEDLYPGWDGLAAGSGSVAAALAAGEYRRYDWVAGRFAETVRLDPERPLLIEGCGALTAANLAAARAWAERAAAGDGRGPLGDVLGIWIEAPAELRKRRALARDGEMYAPHWDRWAAQEDALYAAERPWLLADRVLAAGR